MGPPLKLLDDSSEEETEAGFTINKNYADRYDIWRQKEELQKLKDLSKEVSSSSSESEEEEEPEIEKDFLKTLSLLKSKDPRIYDEKTEFFTEESAPKKPKVKKEKPMFMKDYERKIVLEQNGVFVDEEDEDNQYLHQRPLLTNKEEEEVRKSFQAAVPDSDNEEDDLFQVRTKTKPEEEKEEADYKQWLETEKDMLFLNKCWKDPKISEDEKFLRDYILNKRYVTDDKPGEIPMYDEITQDIDLLNEDEKELEKQETFEHKYNFRFEEPDEEFIKSYPRTIGDSLRRENTKRKQRREEYAERKKKEKEQKREELKRLKALKRKEIEEKFLKLKEASGRDELNFDESDIESDFDPDKHDQKMREMFNDDYYDVEEEQKPEFEYDEEIDDVNWDRWTRDQIQNNPRNVVDERGEESGCEEEEYDPKNDLRAQFEQEMIDSTTSNKNKRGRKKSLFAKIISQPKPLYDPSGKSFDEYLDEYYKLDYEDIVGDMPVRFKYRKVVPNDFGLTVDEILAAQDKELNRWCSVKKTCQYRDDKDEIYDVQAFKKKAQNLETKKKVLASVYTPPEDEKIPQTNADNSNEAAAKPKRKKKRSKKKKNVSNPDAAEEGKNSEQQNSSENVDANKCPESPAEVNNQPKRKKKKKKSLTNMQGESSGIEMHEDENGLVEDVQQSTFDQELHQEDAENETNQNLVIGKKKKKKNKSKVLEENDSLPNNESFIESDELNESNVKNSIKKKRKKSQSMEAIGSTVEPQNGLEMNENAISKKKKRKRDSSEIGSSSSFVEYNEDDEAEAKNSQNVMKKKKVESVAETDLSSVQQPKKRKSDPSFSQQNATKSIYAEKADENDSNRKKNKKKHKNNQQSFGWQQSQKQNFHSQKFQSNKKQNDPNSIQIVDNSGKKIIASNTRLSAFEINPQKFKKKMIYGKNQS